jgi:O-antigen ligase
MLPVAFRITRLSGVLAAILVLGIVAFTLRYGLSEFVRFGDSRWTETTATRDAVGRLDMIAALLGAWAASGTSIVFGLGNSAAFDPTLIGIYPHNVPLETLGEEGVIGFILYLYVLWLVYRGFMRTWKASRAQPELRGLLAATMGNFLFTFLISLKEGNMVSAVYFFLYAILISRMGQLSALPQTQATRAHLPTPAAAPARPVALSPTALFRENGALHR